MTDRNLGMDSAEPLSGEDTLEENRETLTGLTFTSDKT